MLGWRARGSTRHMRGPLGYPATGSTGTAVISGSKAIGRAEIELGLLMKTPRATTRGFRIYARRSGSHGPNELVRARGYDPCNLAAFVDPERVFHVASV